jgi:hypothetical protein
MVGHELRRSEFAVSQLRVLVDVPSPRDELVFDRGDPRLQVGGQKRLLGRAQALERDQKRERHHDCD